MCFYSYYIVLLKKVFDDFDQKKNIYFIHNSGDYASQKALVNICKTFIWFTRLFDTIKHLICFKYDLYASIFDIC